MHMSELVVGDLIQLSTGMEIPADGLLIESSEITADESAMTGKIKDYRNFRWDQPHEEGHLLAMPEEKGLAD